MLILRFGIDVGCRFRLGLVLLAIDADIADDRRTRFPYRHASESVNLQRFGGDVDQRLQVIAVAAFVR
ncbi:hypothetical protein D3C81_1372920 [compost metagenome]